MVLARKNWSLHKEMVKIEKLDRESMLDQNKKVKYQTTRIGMPKVCSWSSGEEVLKIFQNAFRRSSK